MPPDPSSGLDALARVQQQFASALFDSRLAPDIVPQFRGDPALVERRLALYRGNQSVHWEQALAAAYPVLKRQVGDEFFYHLGRAYGRGHPSPCGDLNGFGDALAPFLKGFAPVDPYPWLPDLARLEWALHLAHSAADSPPLAAAALLTLSPDELDDLPLALHPACALLDLGWDVSTLWQAHQCDPIGDWRAGLARPVTALVWRAQWRAQQRPLDPPEAAALRALAAGAPLGTVLEAAAGLAADEPIDGLLVRWLSDGVLVSGHTHRRPRA
jgi:hypothetical protein